MPSPGDCLFVQQLSEPALREETEETIRAASEADRVRWLRTAIRLRDPVAATIAATWPHLRAGWLDAWERALVFRLRLDAAIAGAAPHAEEGAGALGAELIARDAFAALLARFEAAPADAAARILEPEVAGDLAGAEQIPALVRLARDGDPLRAATALRALNSLAWDDERAATALREALPRVERDPALARELGERRDDVMRVLRAAETGPDASLTSLPDREALLAALAEGGRTWHDALERLRAAMALRGPGASSDPVPWAAGFDAALLASKLDWIALADAAEWVPGCRTRAVAEEVVRRLPLASPPELAGSSTADADNALAFAETGAHDALVRRLTEWLAEPGAGATAYRLARIGGPAEASALVAWAKRARAESWASVPWSTLAEIRSPAVRAFLVAHVEDGGVSSPSLREAMEGIARLDGLPVVDAWNWPPTEAERESVRDLVFAARPVDAFAAALPSNPDELVEGEAAVRDPRVRAHLEGLRARRELGLYARATIDLALHGDDAAALAETRTALEAGYPDWLTAFGDALRGRDAPAWTPLMLELLATGSAAQRQCAAEFFEWWYGWEPRGPTAAADAAAWWARHGGRFTWSRLSAFHVPAPR